MKIIIMMGAKTEKYWLISILPISKTAKLKKHHDNVIGFPYNHYLFSWGRYKLPTRYIKQLAPLKHPHGFPKAPHVCWDRSLHGSALLCTCLIRWDPRCGWKSSERSSVVHRSGVIGLYTTLHMRKYGTWLGNPITLDLCAVWRIAHIFSTEKKTPGMRVVPRMESSPPGWRCHF